VAVYVSFHILVNVVAYLTDIFAGPIMCNSGHYNDISHRVQGICLNSEHFRY
jgi:hypothetical protein